jgi:hypothetical protein
LISIEDSDVGDCSSERKTRSLPALSFSDWDRRHVGIGGMVETALGCGHSESAVQKSLAEINHDAVVVKRCRIKGDWWLVGDGDNKRLNHSFLYITSFSIGLTRSEIKKDSRFRGSENGRKRISVRERRLRPSRWGSRRNGQSIDILRTPDRPRNLLLHIRSQPPGSLSPTPLRNGPLAISMPEPSPLLC